MLIPRGIAKGIIRNPYIFPAYVTDLNRFVVSEIASRAIFSQIVLQSTIAAFCWKCSMLIGRDKI